MKNSIKNIALVLFVMTFSAQAKEVKSKKIQVLINPAVATFTMNTDQGAGFITNIFAPRPTGANYLVNGWILPKHTINKHQSSYLVDKHGNTITSNDAVGTWWSEGIMLQDLDFSNLSPLLGQNVILSTDSFLFNKECHDTMNNLYATGPVVVKVNSLNQISFTYPVMSVFAETLYEHESNHNEYETNIYFDSNNVVLLEIKFKHKIEYKD